jgi:hypothetical protein
MGCEPVPSLNSTWRRSPATRFFISRLHAALIRADQRGEHKISLVSGDFGDSPVITPDGKVLLMVGFCQLQY